MGPRVVSKTSYFDFKREPLYGDERMKFVVIQSISDVEGIKLMKTILKSLIQKDVKVAFHCIDSSIDNLVHGLDIDLSKTTVFDEFKDYSTFKEPLLSCNQYIEKLSNFEGFLCIYSLSSLILQKDIGFVYRTFHKLLSANPKIQVLSLCYSDVHSSSEDEILSNFATATLTIDPKGGDSKFLMVTSTRNKSFGQIWYEYQIESDFTFKTVSVITSKCCKVQAKKPDPTANLTFNLNLNESEKEARSQLQLPYTKTQTSDSVTIQDVEDDLFEEEDPDDDLGFLDAI